MLRKLIGLIAFALTGMGLIAQTITGDLSLLNTLFLVVLVCLLAVSLVEQYNELKG